MLTGAEYSEKCQGTVFLLLFTKREEPDWQGRKYERASRHLKRCTSNAEVHCLPHPVRGPLVHGLVPRRLSTILCRIHVVLCQFCGLSSRPLLVGRSPPGIQEFPLTQDLFTPGEPPQACLNERVCPQRNGSQPFRPYADIHLCSRYATARRWSPGRSGPDVFTAGMMPPAACSP